MRAVGGIVEDAVVDVEYLEDVQKLALVGVEALDLHVEDRGRVEHDAGRLLDVGGETVLVGPLGLLHALEEGRVVLERDELLELHGVIEPPVTDGVGNETRVCGIGLGEGTDDERRRWSCC